MSSTVEGEIEFTWPGIDKPLKTWYKVAGDLSRAQTASPDTPLIILHGGPGFPSTYLNSLFGLAMTHNIPVIIYDQIGSGHSTRLPEKAGDGAFWTEALFIAQLKDLITHLKLREYDIMGHSWGGMLGSRFAAQQPEGLRRLVLFSVPASADLWAEAQSELLNELPEDVQVVIRKHEADGTTSSPEYQEVMVGYYAQFSCRVDPIPNDLATSLEEMEEDPTVIKTMCVVCSIDLSFNLFSVLWLFLGNKLILCCEQGGLIRVPHDRYAQRLDHYQ